MENKLHTWQGKLLSYGGRLILLGSSLSNVPLYIVSLFELLKGTEKRCDIFRKCLLWWKVLLAPGLHCSLYFNFF
jgi:hypothetical protein